MFAYAVSWLGGMATFAQVLLALPMALDLLGPPSFLLLSLLFTLHHTIYSSLRLLLKNTVLAPTITILSLLSPAITALLILFTLYTFLNPPSAGEGHIFGASAGHILVDVLPYLYASVLRWVSPMFTLLEGVSTLLVVQVLGRVGRDWADDDEKEEGLEWRSLVGLVAAALLYCAGLAWLVWAFPPTSTSSVSAFLLGCAITSVLFLSLIGFSLRRTNVLETSLVFLYVVNVRVTTVVLAYRRAILIAVYTHLLLLDGGSQTWWRWINIALFLSVWSLELMLDADDDTESVTRWKVD
ncbi:hypothetical protein Q5752_005219 [Cryptotrichosporon argae]